MKHIKTPGQLFYPSRYPQYMIQINLGSLICICPGKANQKKNNNSVLSSLPAFSFPTHSFFQIRWYLLSDWSHLLLCKSSFILKYNNNKGWIVWLGGRRGSESSFYSFFSRLSDYPSFLSSLSPMLITIINDWQKGQKNHQSPACP